MKRYWVKNLEDGYWCMTRMKPSNSSDIPKNYSYQGYWSKFDDSYSISKRIRYLWITAQFERAMMKLLGNIKTTLEVVS